MKYSIIIPCYNEEANIKKLIELLDLKYNTNNIEWIMIENGSNDNTRELLKNHCKNKKNFQVVFIDKNQGYGYGIKKGIENSKGEYIGWLHADMQVSPDTLFQFIELNEKINTNKNFYKGLRKNRSIIDNFFTFSMGIFVTLVFQTHLFDIGAIPVLFHKNLVKKLNKIPYDFSIETYVYYIAKKEKYKIIRLPINMCKREGGTSSWNKGLLSKFKQSWIIVKNLIKIRLSQ